jgi:tetratricopeptide (TPR) repeat protein
MAEHSEMTSQRVSIYRVGVLIALFGLVFLVQSRIDAAFGEYRATEEILYVENGELLKHATVGFENLVADLYWLRAVQYFGGKRLEVTNKNYDLLQPLLDITISLDPNFKIAYTYGATFLSEPFPMGAGRPLEGIELIDKGIANHPDYWRFYLDKGFVYYWYLQDYEKAAQVFLEGSKIEGAPYWMVATAGRALARGGDRETSRALWHILHDSAETVQQRENANLHLKQLDALDEMDELKELVERFHEQKGSYPESFGELVSAGLIRALPVDPTGAPYVLDPETHKIDLSPSSGLGVLPTR